jgi:hypothetical protein
MASSQIAYAGSDVVVTLNVIDSTGTHQAATGLNASRLSSHPSAVPVVTNPNSEPGVYVLTWSSLSPATSEGDSIVALIEGSVNSTPFSTYAIPLKVVANERGTDNASTFDNAVDTVITDAASRTASQADVSLLATTADLAVVDGNVDAIKVKTDQLAFTVANQVDANSLTGGTSPADIYTYFTTGTNEDAFKADVTGISAQISALNDLSTTDVENSVWDAAYASHTSAGTFGKLMDILRKANRGIEGTVSGTPTASAFDTNLTGYTTGAFDSETLVFLSGALEGEARPILSYNATNGRITFEEALTAAPTAADEFIILPYHVHPISEIYSYFVDGSNEDAFKADVSALATSSDLATVDSNVDSIKSVTDQMVFTVSGQIDANALTGGGGDDAATIYSYFTASNRQDQFKADVSSVGGVVGSGAISHEITVNVAGSPSDGVEVWVSTDSSGSNVVAGTLVTDAFGKATFMLDAGTYYLWAQKAGNNFANPTSFSVS